MKKIIFVMSMMAVLFVFEACKPKSEPQNEFISIHNSRNSLDWNGVYAGILPRADCSGISVQITLNLDETYSLTFQYLDRDEAPVSVSGVFIWNEAGGIITLDNSSLPPHYKVGENRLIQLDLDGNLITGEFADKYVLEKVVL